MSEFLVAPPAAAVFQQSLEKQLEKLLTPHNAYGWVKLEQISGLCYLKVGLHSQIEKNSYNLGSYSLVVSKGGVSRYWNMTCKMVYDGRNLVLPLHAMVGRVFGDTQRLAQTLLDDALPKIFEIHLEHVTRVDDHAAQT